MVCVVCGERDVSGVWCDVWGEGCEWCVMWCGWEGCEWCDVVWGEGCEWCVVWCGGRDVSGVWCGVWCDV